MGTYKLYLHQEMLHIATEKWSFLVEFLIPNHPPPPKTVCFVNCS